MAATPAIERLTAVQKDREILFFRYEKGGGKKCESKTLLKEAGPAPAR